jgi:hypothetical protein
MAGRLLLRSLSHFRALEAEEGGRGDGQDGVLTYAMEGGLPLSRREAAGLLPATLRQRFELRFA